MKQLLKGRALALVVVTTLTAACSGTPKAAPPPPPVAAAGAIDRTVLPIAEPSYPAVTEVDARKATPPARFEVKAPEGAPNVVIVLIDDIGFGQPSTFGGPIHMPTLDRWPRAGCATTASTPRRSARRRATALLTGRNHHVNNAGAIMELATASPATPACGRTASRRWPRSCGRTATARPPSASTTRRALGSVGLGPVRPLADPARASTSSTASSAARPTSGRRRSTTA